MAIRDKLRSLNELNGEKSHVEARLKRETPPENPGDFVYLLAQDLVDEDLRNIDIAFSVPDIIAERLGAGEADVIWIEHKEGDTFAIRKTAIDTPVDAD